MVGMSSRFLEELGQVLHAFAVEKNWCQVLHARRKT
jgi:hypothetical protein